MRTRAEAVGPGAIGLPVVVVAELLEGRLQYLRTAHHLAPRQLAVAFEQLTATMGLLSLFPVIPFDEAALRVYQRRRLFPGTMSRADRLIAAIALSGDHRLVTRNVSRLVAVSELAVENWTDEKGPRQEPGSWPTCQNPLARLPLLHLLATLFERLSISSTSRTRSHPSVPGGPVPDLSVTCSWPVRVQGSREDGSGVPA